MELIQLLYDIQLANWIHTSAIAGALYDSILVIPREVEHIWKSEWSLVKVLYLISRYYGLFLMLVHYCVGITIQTSIPLCKLFTWYTTLGGGATVMLVVVNWILIIRLHALYERSVPVLIFLITITAAEFATQVYLLIRLTVAINTNLFLAPPGIPLPGCLTTPKHVERILLLSWYTLRVPTS